MKEFEYVTCKSCGWCHFSVSLDYAKSEVEKFNNYYNTLDKEKQELYYGSKPSSLEKDYLHCMFCDGPHDNFRDYNPGTDTNLNGHTVNPIVHYSENI